MYNKTSICLIFWTIISIVSTITIISLIINNINNDKNRIDTTCKLVDKNINEYHNFGCLSYIKINFNIPLEYHHDNINVTYYRDPDNIIINSNCNEERKWLNENIRGMNFKNMSVKFLTCQIDILNPDNNRVCFYDYYYAARRLIGFTNHCLDVKKIYKQSEEVIFLLLIIITISYFGVICSYIKWKKL